MRIGRVRRGEVRVGAVGAEVMERRAGLNGGDAVVLSYCHQAVRLEW